MRRIAVLLLALLTGVSCGGEDRDRPRVLVFGDSVVRSAQGDVRQALRGDYNTSVALHIGPVAAALPKLRSQLAARPDIAIIELGSGDALDGIETWRKNLDAIVRAAEDLPCVVFVTVNPVTDYYHSVLAGELLTIAREWNTALRTAVRTRPNRHLVDWAGAVTADPRLVSDGTHPNEKGAAWLSEQFVAATRAC